MRRSRTITDTSNIEAGFQTTINEHNNYMIDFKSKKEKDEAVFITTTLKGQLSQAVAKADQVPAL